MLQWIEERMRRIAAAEPDAPARFLHADASHAQEGKRHVLEQADYRAVRYFYEMPRPTLEDIPHWPLPPGVEIRPAAPEHYA